MLPLQYALVAYVNKPVGRFVEDLRRELHPEQAHLPAHITVLPPRSLHGSEPEALELLERLCGQVAPFEAAMGEVASFAPATPTVFLRVAHAAYRLRELHDLLNTDSLHCQEQWPYMPHLTIAKMPDLAQAARALEISRSHWDDYRGTRVTLVDQLTFVREGQNNRWIDLAPVHLGRSLAPAHR